jgi:hypothetical protein
MTHSRMTQWTEDAEARRFSQIASWNQGPAATDSHYFHLCETITKVSSSLRQGISHGSLAAIGCQALAYVRHPLERSSR